MSLTISRLASLITLVPKIAFIITEALIKRICIFGMNSSNKAESNLEGNDFGRDGTLQNNLVGGSIRDPKFIDIADLALFRYSRNVNLF